MDDSVALQDGVHNMTTKLSANDVIYAYILLSSLRMWTHNKQLIVNTSALNKWHFLVKTL